jgi:hypothetical protein
LYDRIEYNQFRASGWIDSSALAPPRPILRPIFDENSDEYDEDYEYADHESLEQIVRQALVPLDVATKNYAFPGFGSIVLADCVNRTDILHKAIAYRNSDTAIAIPELVVTT